MQNIGEENEGEHKASPGNDLRPLSVAVPRRPPRVADSPSVSTDKEADEAAL